jgi:ubiquinone/menaquinone biosynthesis C-methylase UbiE
MNPCDEKLKSRVRKSNLKAYSGKWGYCYDSSLWVRFWIGKWDREIIRELGDNLSSIKILDIGCATGRLLCSLATAGARNLAGTDIASKIVELAGENLSKMNIAVDLRVSDAEDRLPWGDNVFDAVTMTGVLHHFFRPSPALVEVYRVLRQGGELIIIEPRFVTPLRQAVNLYLRFFSHAGDSRFYSPTQATELMRTCGFIRCMYRKMTFHSFILIGGKS